MDSTVSRRAFVTGAAACAGTACLGAAGATWAIASEQPAASTSAQPQSQTPRYVFLFIGDGMSYPQVQATAYYRGALATAGAEPAIERLSFMDFPVVGAQCTYDSTSVCPDSASTATAIASGHRTASGVINVAPDDDAQTFETVAEKLKAQKGTRIGIVTSVNLNHATPAAFYAHQPSRRNYYEIGEELAASGFDYFAGGALLAPEGPDGDRESLYDVAAKAGYTVAQTYDAASKLTAADLPAVVVSEVLADEDAISYELDRAQGEWALADYVARGIELLSGVDEASDDAGFFMMCEGGKIDWACHANDCAATIHDVCALDEAVQWALDVYEAHPDETLVVVTGDHETGGLTIGYAETNYDSFLANLEAQKISYARFDSDYVARYIEEQTPFADALADVEELFGLKTPEAAQGEEGGPGTLVLTDYELGLLQDSYERTLAQAPRSQDEMTQEEYVHYGTYEPFSVTLTHVLNHKVGVDFATYAHSGLTVPVFALGCGAEAFEGYYDNTQIYQKLAALTGVA